MTQATGINGHTTLVGLIAWPIGHRVSPGRVEAAVRWAAALGFRGVNVTVPHKQAVIPALDAVAPDVAQFGAVNTIVIEQDAAGQPTTTGHNTDYQGFLGALRQGGFEPGGKSAGGTPFLNGG